MSFSLKAKDLLQRQGFEVEDNWLTTREQVDLLLEDEESRKALLTIIRNGSTLIWHYVNLHGEYDFTHDI